MESSKRIIPYTLIPPGFTLKEELTERNIKQKDFAQKIGMRPSHLSEIINGKRPITKYIAERFEGALNIPADFWLRLQASYDYEVAVKEYNYTGKEVIPNNFFDPTSHYDQKNISILEDPHYHNNKLYQENAYQQGYIDGKRDERRLILDILKSAGIDISNLEL